MAERDRVIKTGQITLPRLLFLAVFGGLIVFTVYQGGVFLAIGYWLLTLAICGLLVLVAVDYGVKMDKVDAAGTPATVPDSVIAAPVVKTTMGEGSGPKVKRKSARPAKRRR